MSVSLQADPLLPQGHILVDGQRVASVSTTGGLSATLAPNTVTTSALVSGSVTTEKIANNSITPAKMSGGQTGSAPVYGCRAWVNFNGAAILGIVNAPTTESIVVTTGSDLGIWNVSTGTISHFSGVKYLITSIGGVPGALLGGVDVTTTGVQLVSAINSTQYRIRLLAGPALSNQTITGNNTSSGFVYNGTGIRESGNVSSVIKNGTGDYTINFAIPMPDAHYSVVATNRSTFFSGVAFSTTCAINNSDSALTPSSVQVVHIPAGDVGGYSGQVNDTAVMCVSIFR